MYTLKAVVESDTEEEKENEACHSADDCMKVRNDVEGRGTKECKTDSELEKFGLLKYNIGDPREKSPAADKSGKGDDKTQKNTDEMRNKETDTKQTEDSDQLEKKKEMKVSDEATKNHVEGKKEMKESDEKKNTDEVRKKERETEGSYELEKKKDMKESDKAAKNDVENKEEMKYSEEKSVGNDRRQKKGNELKKEETSEESTSEESMSEESMSEESDESNKTDRKETKSEVTGANVQQKAGSHVAPDYFNCFYCEQTFSTPNSLRYHLDYVHPWNGSSEGDSETKNEDVSSTKEMDNKNQEVNVRSITKLCMELGVKEK